MFPSWKSSLLTGTSDNESDNEARTRESCNCVSYNDNYYLHDWIQCLPWLFCTVQLGIYDNLTATLFFEIVLIWVFYFLGKEQRGTKGTVGVSHRHGGELNTYYSI